MSENITLQVKHVVVRLGREFPEVPPDELQALVEREFALLGISRVPDYVSVLAERRLRPQLGRRAS